METARTDQPAYEPQELDESSVVRYVIAALGAAGVGIGATLAARRPHRPLLGGGLAVVGAALLVRGVRGQWPRLWRGKTAQAEAPSAPAEGWGENQGEGNRTAARHYNEEVRDFVDHGRVGAAARSAAIAVEGPEGPELRAAEAKARTSPTNGH